MRGSPVSTAAVTKFANPMFVMNRPRFSTWSTGSCSSFHSATLAGEHAGVDADVGDGLGERERGAPGPAILAGLRWRGERHVVAHLLRRAALVDRRQLQEPGERARRGARVDPGELERGERGARFFGPEMKPPSSGSMNAAVMPDAS